LPKQLEDVEETNINSCGARAFSDPTIEPIHPSPTNLAKHINNIK
jgi:hypothetical protein